MPDIYSAIDVEAAGSKRYFFVSGVKDVLPQLHGTDIVDYVAEDSAVRPDFAAKAVGQTENNKADCLFSSLRRAVPHLCFKVRLLNNHGVGETDDYIRRP